MAEPSELSVEERVQQLDGMEPAAQQREARRLVCEYLEMGAQIMGLSQRQVFKRLMREADQPADQADWARMIKFARPVGPSGKPFTPTWGDVKRWRRTLDPCRSRLPQFFGDSLEHLEPDAVATALGEIVADGDTAPSATGAGDAPRHINHGDEHG